MTAVTGTLTGRLWGAIIRLQLFDRYFLSLRTIDSQLRAPQRIVMVCNQQQHKKTVAALHCLMKMFAVHNHSLTGPKNCSKFNMRCHHRLKLIFYG